MIPVPHPELAKASGPANNPEPREDLMRFAADLTSLKFRVNKYEPSRNKVETNDLSRTCITIGIPTL